MLCDVPLHPRTRSTKGPDCPNDIQKRLRSPRQHLDDRQHSINPLPKRPAIDQRTEFVRLVRIHELFRLVGPGARASDPSGSSNQAVRRENRPDRAGHPSGGSPGCSGSMATDRPASSGSSNADGAGGGPGGAGNPSSSPSPDEPRPAKDGKKSCGPSRRRRFAKPRGGKGSPPSVAGRRTNMTSPSPRQLSGAIARIIPGQNPISDPVQSWSKRGCRSTKTKLARCGLH